MNFSTFFLTINCNILLKLSKINHLIQFLDVPTYKKGIKTKGSTILQLTSSPGVRRPYAQPPSPHSPGSSHIRFFENVYPVDQQNKMFSEKNWEALCILQTNNLLTRNSSKSHFINILKNLNRIEKQEKGRQEKAQNVPKRLSLMFCIEIVEYSDISTVLIYFTDKIQLKELSRKIGVLHYVKRLITNLFILLYIM